jgi:hypothetical protein
MPDSIADQLDELAEIRAAADVTRQDYETRREEILKVVRAELEALEAEYQPLLTAAQERTGALETEIKQAVLQQGASVKGRRVQAVYVRGRVSWDNARLDQYAAAHPEVREFRKEGKPSVSLRLVE